MKKEKFYLQVTMVAATLMGCYAILSESPSSSQTALAAMDSEEIVSSSSSGRSPASVSKSAVAKAQKAKAPVIKYNLAEEALLKTSDVNKWERKLKESIISRRHADKIQGGEEMGGVVISEMKKSPRESLAAFESLLAKLPAEDFPFDRASLIDVMGDFPELREQAREIARQELANSVAKPKVIPQEGLSQPEFDRVMSSDDFDFLPMISHSVVIRTSRSAAEALDLTVEAIGHQQDLGIRGTIANQFTAAYPQLEKNLNDALSRKRIAMPADQSSLPN